ncbi:hypothetical protein BKA70DRAFT_1448388 [Coprinopsis sp. MPI-PUGE-AT-0042]|nr:hypothetical protein BKA70DRAFT_1448388 [Coprinopsis sp. MPI-PUGE-AT-0042]
MDETHDDYPIDPAIIEELQQFLRIFKRKTTEPKFKKVILAKVEDRLSILTCGDLSSSVPRRFSFSSSPDSEGEVESEPDEKHEEEGLREPNKRTTVKDEKEGTEAMRLSSSVKKSLRKRKEKMDDNNADADEDVFVAPEPVASTKTKNSKGKKRNDTPDFPAIYDSKGSVSFSLPMSIFRPQLSSRYPISF